MPSPTASTRDPPRHSGRLLWPVDHHFHLDGRIRQVQKKVLRAPNLQQRTRPRTHRGHSCTLSPVVVSKVPVSTAPTGPGPAGCVATATPTTRTSAANSAVESSGETNTTPTHVNGAAHGFPHAPPHMFEAHVLPDLGAFGADVGIGVGVSPLEQSGLAPAHSRTTARPVRTWKEKTVAVVPATVFGCRHKDTILLRVGDHHHGFGLVPSRKVRSSLLPVVRVPLTTHRPGAVGEELGSSPKVPGDRWKGPYSETTSV